MARRDRFSARKTCKRARGRAVAAKAKHCRTQANRGGACPRNGSPARRLNEKQKLSENGKPPVDETQLITPGNARNEKDKKDEKSEKDGDEDRNESGEGQTDESKKPDDGQPEKTDQNGHTS